MRQVIAIETIISLMLYGEMKHLWVTQKECLLNKFRLRSRFTVVTKLVGIEPCRFKPRAR